MIQLWYLCRVELAVFCDDAEGEFRPDELGSVGVVGEEEAENVGAVDCAGWSREELVEGDKVFAEEIVEALVEVLAFC